MVRNLAVSSQRSSLSCVENYNNHIDVFDGLILLGNGGACRNRTGAVGVLQTPVFPLHQRATLSVVGTLSVPPKLAYILPEWAVFNNQLW